MCHLSRFQQTTTLYTLLSTSVPPCRIRGGLLVFLSIHVSSGRKREFFLNDTLTPVIAARYVFSVGVPASEPLAACTLRGMIVFKSLITLRIPAHASSSYPGTIVIAHKLFSEESFLYNVYVMNVMIYSACTRLAAGTKRNILLHATLVALSDLRFGLLCR